MTPQKLKRLSSKKRVNLYEETLLQHIRALKLSDPVREYRFHPVRKWLFDFAWPDLKIAVEVEGGVWTNGRHTRGAGFTEDCNKYNQAALLGWIVFRFPTSMVTSGEAIRFIEDAMRMGGDKKEKGNAA